jgi:hypothetical protein
MNKLVIVLLLCACRSSDNPAPMEAPSLSADGKVKVPPGHETTFTFDGKPTRLEYTWLEVLSYESKPALRILAQGGPHHGMLTIAMPIAEGTHKLDQMAGVDIGAFPNGISFGNAPVMATGTGGIVKISEVTPQYVSGTFQAQACETGQQTCDKPMQVTNGTFKAFRSALSDDAAFSRYAK